jgi:molecular chaperone HscB
MEMMEAREELAEAARARDIARVTRLGEGMAARSRAILDRLGREFNAAGGDVQKLTKVLLSLGELRYVRRFLDEVSAIEEELVS